MTRNTGQRRAIRAVFERINRPLTPQEVLDEAQKDIEGLGIATVYRNLKTLSEARWLSPVEIPGEPTRYELAGLDHHHHFHCHTCDRVFDLPGCPGIKGMVPEDYQVSRHELLVFGTCPECACVMEGK